MQGQGPGGAWQFNIPVRIDVAAVVTFLLARIGATGNFSELIANPVTVLLVFCLDLSPPTAMAPVDLGRGKGKPGRRKDFFGWLK